MIKKRQSTYTESHSLLQTSECFYYVAWGERFLRQACASATVLRSITEKPILIFFEGDMRYIPEDVARHLSGICVDVVKWSCNNIKDGWAYDYPRFHEGCNVPKYPACYLDCDFVMFGDTSFDLKEDDKLIFFHFNNYYYNSSVRECNDAKQAELLSGIAYNIRADEHSLRRVNNGLFLVFDKRSCQEVCMLMRVNRILVDYCFGEWVTSSMCSFFDHVSIKSPSKTVSFDTLGYEFWYEKDTLVSKSSFFSYHHLGHDSEKRGLTFIDGRMVAPELQKHEDADYRDTFKFSISSSPNKINHVRSFFDVN